MVQAGVDLLLGAGDHVVQCYEDEGDLVDVVVGHLWASLRADRTVVAIATAGHAAAFRSALTLAGIDVVSAVADGRLVLLDASATLAAFIVDDRPDTARFDSVVGDALRSAAAKGRPVTAFGEMVSLLWDEGNVAGAMELEALWDRLADDVAFSLFCAYRSSSLGAGDARARVCDVHTQVVARAPRSPDAEVTRRFAASLESAGAARRFTVETLSSWGLDDLADGCTLVVSELAANALRHAESDFTVSFARRPGGVRVTVGDASTTAPAWRDVDAIRLGGRGLRLVEAIASGWGHAPIGGGKLVWADVVTGRGREPASTS